MLYITTRQSTYCESIKGTKIRNLRRHRKFDRAFSSIPDHIT